MLREVKPLSYRRASESDDIVRHEVAPTARVDVLSALIDVVVQSNVPSADEELARRSEKPDVYQAPPVEVLRLRNACVETGMCVVVKDGNYVPDTLRSHRQAGENGYSRNEHGFTLPDFGVQPLDGPALLVGLPVGRNYFHWLFEAVARWLLARDVVGEGVKLLVQDLNPMEQSALEAVGVPSKSLIVMPERALLKIDDLWVARRGVMASALVFPAAVAALREVVAGEDGPKERLFISRAGAQRRRISNESAVLRVLRRHGFTPIRAEDLSVRAQAERFANAEAVVGMHGAGLANFAFCPPGATLIELQPPMLNDARMVLYWHIAAAAGQRYAQIICREAPGQGDIPQPQRDIKVKTRQLDATLRKILP